MKITFDEVEALVVAQIDNPAFTPRSREYRIGVKECLMSRFCGFKPSSVPGWRNRPGTAQFDAYQAGHERGWRIYRAWQEEQEHTI